MIPKVTLIFMAILRIDKPPSFPCLVLTQWQHTPIL